MASGYHFVPTTNPPRFAPATATKSRKRAEVPADVAIWPELPERCFGSVREIPEWLLRPWQLLQDVAQWRRPLSARLTDLMRVAEAVDELFTTHLPVERAWMEQQSEQGAPVAEQITRYVDELIAEATQLFMHQLRPALTAEGVNVRSVAQLDEWQREWLHRHFIERIYPLLTPLAVDPGRPFPYISSDSLNLLIELHRVEGIRGGNLFDRNILFARVKVPRATPRLVAVPSQPSQTANSLATTPATTLAPTVYVASADLVRFFVRHLFPGMPVRHVYLFRLVRGDQPLPGACGVGTARQRRQDDKPVVRLDVEQRMAAPVLDWLVDHLRLPRYALAQHDRLFDWSCLPDLVALVRARETE